MSESKSFRIILDLSRFFLDHRRIARIFIKSNLKNIEDLQNRISEIFAIQGFYLSTGGHFLPPSEDIRILHNDETICVHPNEVDARNEYLEVSSTHLNNVKNKQQKRALDDMAEENTGTSSPKKKKKKKHHTSKDVPFISSSEDESKHKRKLQGKSEKESKNTKNIKSKLEDQEQTEKREKPEKDKDKNVCDETPTKIVEIKRKLKQKADEYSQKHFNVTPVNVEQNFKTVLPKLQTHIKNYNNSGRPTISDTVRLSRHVDTPIKTFSKYTTPIRITDRYLAKTKINIVKIDVIKENTEEATTNRSCEPKSKCNTSNEGDSHSESYVKTIVNSIEMNLSPEGKVSTNIPKDMNKRDPIVDISQNEASNYTKIYLDQKNANASNVVINKPENANVSNGSSIDTSNLCTAPESISEAEQRNKTCEDVSPLKLNATATDTSLDISTTLPNTHSSHDAFVNSVRDSTDITVDSNSNTLQTSKRRSSSKMNSGVGSLLEHLRESDSVLSQESDSSQYVTKRRRTRKRKRNSKKIEEKQELELAVTNPMPKLITKSCPIMHIKFEDSTLGVDEKSSEISSIQVEPTYKQIEKDQVVNNVSKTETTTLTIGETVVISDENDDTVVKNESMYRIENILKAPLMENKIEPKVGDIIAFKILKMTENYSPQISGYITGKVEMYLTESKVVYFKILNGLEELLPPSGKLSLDSSEKEDLQNSKYKEFSWSELFEQRLLYP